MGLFFLWVQTPKSYSILGKFDEITPYFRETGLSKSTHIVAQPHNRKLGTKHSSHDTVKISFFWRVHDWNSLHQDTVDATGVDAFKNRLNKP